MDKNQHEPAHAFTEVLNANIKDYSHFLNLDDEKRDRILTAAYNEFLEKGYGEASTNTITQKAGISKGLLFHYFGSKEGLYKFLMKESARRIASETLSSLPAKNGDVFAIIQSVIQLKIRVCSRCPRETDFLIAAWAANLPERLSLERENMAGMSDNYFNVVIALLDDSLLRDSVEKNVAAEIIAWVCEKYTDKALSSGAMEPGTENWHRTAQDLDTYMDALRHGLYK